MGDPRQARAREIQNAIRNVLYRYWDPIGGADLPMDEYDAYIGGVYRLLVNDASDAAVVEHLRRVSPGGIDVSDTRLHFVVRKLLQLDVHIRFSV